MTRLNYDINVSHKCCSVSSFKGIIGYDGVLLDNVSFASLQRSLIVIVCVSLDGV